ncbi:MAG: hypothetical protein N2654_07265, partial [Deltaproteobacteria bacterium]|nr:hypothetical protein [Deltaproteobacteria bacterium]
SLTDVIDRDNSSGLSWGRDANSMYLSSLYLLRCALEEREVGPDYPPVLYRQPSGHIIGTIVFGVIIGGFYDALTKELERLLKHPERFVTHRQSPQTVSNTFVLEEILNEFGNQGETGYSRNFLREVVSIVNNFYREIMQIWREWVVTLISGGNTILLGHDFRPPTAIEQQIGVHFEPSKIDDLVEPTLFSTKIERAVGCLERLQLQYDQFKRKFSGIFAENTQRRRDNVYLTVFEKLDEVIDLLNFVKAGLEKRNYESRVERSQARSFELIRGLLTDAETMNAFVVQAYRIAENLSRRALLEFDQGLWGLNFGLIRLLSSRGFEYLNAFPEFLESARSKMTEYFMSEQIHLGKSLTRSLSPSRPEPSLRTRFSDALLKITTYARQEDDCTSIATLGQKPSNVETIFDKPLSFFPIFHELFYFSIEQLIQNLSTEKFDEDGFWRLFTTALNLGFFCSSVVSASLEIESQDLDIKKFINSEAGVPFGICVISQWHALGLVFMLASKGYFESTRKRKVLSRILRDINGLFYSDAFSSFEDFFDFLWARIRQKIANGLEDFDHRGVELSLINQPFEDVILKLYFTLLNSPQDSNNFSLTAEEVVKTVRDSIYDTSKIAHDIPPVFLGALGILLDLMIAVNPVTRELVESEDERKFETRRIVHYLEKFLNVEVFDKFETSENFSEEEVKRFTRIVELLGGTKDELITALDRVSINHRSKADTAEVVVALQFRDQQITITYPLSVSKNLRARSPENLIIQRFRELFAQLTAHILAEGQQLVKDLNLSVEETQKVLQITGWDPIKTSRAKRIIEGIGYQEFLYLHEFFRSMLDELLEDEDLVADPAVFEIVLDIINARLPNEILPARIIVRSDTALSSDKPKIVTQYQREQSEKPRRRQLIVTEYFRRIYSDLTVVSALRDHQRLSDFFDQLSVFQELGLSADEVLSIYNKNRRLLYWQRLFGNYRFKEFWDKEVIDILLWLELIEQSEIADLVLTFPTILEPGLLQKKDDLVSYFANLYDTEDSTVIQEKVVTSVRRCKELLTVKVEDIDFKLTNLVLKMLRVTKDQRRVENIDAVGDMAEESDLSDNRQDGEMTVRKLKQQLITHGPELIFYSGNLERFGTILRYALNAAEKGYITDVSVEELTRLNSYNPVVISLALELFPDYGTSLNFYQFLDSLNRKLRERFGLSKRQQIKGTIDKFIGSENRDELRRICIELVSQQTASFFAS